MNYNKQKTPLELSDYYKNKSHRRCDTVMRHAHPIFWRSRFEILFWWVYPDKCLLRGVLTFFWRLYVFRAVMSLVSSRKVLPECLRIRHKFLALKLSLFSIHNRPKTRRLTNNKVYNMPLNTKAAGGVILSQTHFLCLSQHNRNIWTNTELCRTTFLSWITCNDFEFNFNVSCLINTQCQISLTFPACSCDKAIIATFVSTPSTIWILQSVWHKNVWPTYRYKADFAGNNFGVVWNIFLSLCGSKGRAIKLIGICTVIIQRYFNSSDEGFLLFCNSMNVHNTET